MTPRTSCPIRASTYNTVYVSMGWGLEGDKTRTDKWGIARKLDGTMCRHTSLDGCWLLPQEHADHWGWKEKAAFGLDLGLEF